MKRKFPVIFAASVMAVVMSATAFAAETDYQNNDVEVGAGEGSADAFIDTAETIDEINDAEAGEYEEAAEAYIEETHYYTYDELYANFQADRELYKGLAGDDVASLQSKLTELGYYSSAIDGDFGYYTESAVIAFQTARGLYADGVVGPYTTTALNEGGSNAAGSSAAAADSSSSTSGSQVTSTLSYGSSGAEVKVLQQRLTDLGFLSSPVDGIFGALTEAAVIAFQSANGLYADGVSGPITNGALFAGTGNSTGSGSSNNSGTSASASSISIGMTGDEVLSLQTKLDKLGYLDSDLDGIFGNYTKAAVTAFQNANNLSATGIADSATIAKLDSLITAASDNTTASASAALNASATLSAGMSGTDVYNLQLKLISTGYLSYEATGYFGEITEAAVIAFQKATGLYTDGVAGPITLNKLNGITASSGSTENGSGQSSNNTVLPGDSITGISDSQRAIINSAYSTPTTAAGFCSEWIGNVLSNAGIYFNASNYRESNLSYAAEYGFVDEWYEGDTDFNANDYWAYVCSSSDYSALKPGMIVASRNSYSYLGRQFGHVGIYVGDDTVVSSVGYIEELGLSDWISRYNNTEMGSTVKWGFVQ